ncbi:hypothetical protein TanjilG_04622 [Lupinus angustifolius]|uniref:Uncharacterized protein n=1 Tax=Lupinus angustifolius TaxID=3871 RepID=A0A394DAJ6_LUPAN|nr:hypothetical protein TanjilG_04622 [Lupinus angustifolius]
MITWSQKSDLGQEAIQVKQASGQAKNLTEPTRRRAIWTGQMHQDVGRMHQDVGREVRPNLSSGAPSKHMVMLTETHEQHQALGAWNIDIGRMVILTVAHVHHGAQVRQARRWVHGLASRAWQLEPSHNLAYTGQ